MGLGETHHSWKRTPLPFDSPSPQHYHPKKMKLALALLSVLVAMASAAPKESVSPGSAMELSRTTGVTAAAAALAAAIKKGTAAAAAAGTAEKTHEQYQKDGRTYERYTTQAPRTWYGGGGRSLSDRADLEREDGGCLDSCDPMSDDCAYNCCQKACDGDEDCIMAQCSDADEDDFDDSR